MNRQLTLHEALILDALCECDAPVDLDTLHELSDPRDSETLTFEDMAGAMGTLLSDELISQLSVGGASKWKITPKGHARFIGNEAAKVFAERIPTAPIRASLCNRIEPRIPANALLCVDEDELDDWWKSLDVEQKADAFAGFSLRMYCDSHVAVDGSECVAADLIRDNAPAIHRAMRDEDSKAAR